jgi:aminotransferase
MTVGAAAPLQEGTAFALSLTDEYYNWLGKFYLKARDILYNALKQTDLQPILPKGAYYIMTDCKPYIEKYNLNSSKDLALHLIENVGIATVPGSSFYSDPEDGKNQTRFCFCKKDSTLEKAVNNLKKIYK